MRLKVGLDDRRLNQSPAERLLGELCGSWRLGVNRIVRQALIQVSRKDAKSRKDRKEKVSRADDLILLIAPDLTLRVNRPLL